MLFIARKSTYGTYIYVVPFLIYSAQLAVLGVFGKAPTILKA